MKHTGYFPDAIADKRAWLVIYHDNIDVIGLEWGMLPAEITEEKAWCQAQIDAIDEADAAAAEATSKNQKRDEVIQTKMDLLRAKIAIHKKNTAYTESQGKKLQIIGSEISIDYSTVKTKVDLQMTVEGVSIKFKLMGCEGGNIFCKRAKEENFTFLKYITHPHTIDTRPNFEDAKSEFRQYRVVLVYKDKEVGLASDIAEITV